MRLTRIVWEFMFTRSTYQTADMIEQHKLLNKVARLVGQGIIRTTIAQELEPINAENLRKPHVLLETGRTVGKCLIYYPPFY
nr:zinc-binding dehydrogenase [Paenibacillus lautus]